MINTIRIKLDLIKESQPSGSQHFRDPTQLEKNGANITGATGYCANFDGAIIQQLITVQ